ncbi:hypothetical protein KKE92_00680 [Candidatus Micrarchaeota archaeon]|nr:hypothetical protein [Candidatus Micrarchaeota archaeon]MBU1682066.1 hypothetical protein [Candidatus Micrarchaeota archaeon]
MKKLEITKKLETMAKKPARFGSLLEDSVAILNLPAIFRCQKECTSCVMQGRPRIDREKEGRLPLWMMLKAISRFRESFGTKFVTINGRGDPLHPSLVDETLEKIAFSNSRGIGSYIFTAGENLDDEVCRMLAWQGANVMISLFGNAFVDADFFDGKKYQGKEGIVAKNIRTLISAFERSEKQPEEGLTRLGMNYVVGEKDIVNQSRLMSLRAAANEHGIFFICNVNFREETDRLLRKKIREIAKQNSDFGLEHSTYVDGVCQMGAGSSITIAPDGEIYRCPYMLDGSDGNITTITLEKLSRILSGHIRDRKFSCVLRKTEITQAEREENFLGLKDR